ncbi:MAG: hypothetical protein ACKOXB_05285 [Flavobacteriales bacterium]
MIKRIEAAAEWRIRVFKHLTRRSIWNLKRVFDFSPKEKIDSLSIVVVGRNDNYGGDFSLRLKTTIDWNLARFPNAELIYVEWNPLENKDSDTLWMTQRYPNAKLFIVPNEVHKQYNPKTNFPILEYLAKNLGIRKASGNWIMLINADVLIGPEVSFDKLSKDRVYGTHYNNIKWDNSPITKENISSNIITHFPAPFDLQSVVGNLVLTHRDNWMKMSGYDENLVDVRNGVDSNGLIQLKHLGVKPMILGHHFHLDHPESLINGANATHGTNERILQILSGYNIPYKNKDSWGMNDYEFEQVSPKVWKAKAK